VDLAFQETSDTEINSPITQHLNPLLNPDE
jgi:hypothetical protein